MLPFSGTFLFQKRNDPVKDHGEDTEDHNAHHDNVHFEDLASVDDQIPQSFVGSQEFTDDDANQTETDIYLHVVDDEGDGTGDEDLEQYVPTISSQSLDQLDFIRVHLLEAGVKGHNRTKYSYGNSGGNDGLYVISQPHDENGSKGRFGKTV